MTPPQVVAAARDLYNATGDSFFSDLQIYNWIWQAEHELAMKALAIEATYSGSTVAAQQNYSYPTNAIALKFVTVNGKKVKRITGREDQAITLSNQTATTMGWPIYYTDWNSTIYFRPIPDGIYTLAINYYSDATVPSASGTIDVPVLFHFDLVDYVLMRMYAKDKSLDSAEFHGALWAQHVKDCIIYMKKKRRTDSFATVQSEDNLPVTILGEA